MEWVETTGRTVDEAKDVALDQLGVDEQDAEFEVLEEPRSGLFGRVRTEARVRARVRPSTPRPKAERGRGRGRSGGRTADAATPAPAPAPRSRAAAPAAPVDEDDDDDDRGNRLAAGAGPGRSRGGARRGRTGADAVAAVEDDASTMLSMDQQGDIVRTFLDGLVDAFGLDGDVVIEHLDDETLRANVEGDDLGLLIGPRGQTLQAVQELTKTVVQRHAAGARFGRIHIDVASYRQRRQEALARFAAQVADQVLDSGTAVALEPMGAADRKVVHDVVNEIDGVATVSEGEEPRRRVVILPEDD